MTAADREAALEKKLNRQAVNARYCLGGIVCLMIFAGLLQLYLAVFPDAPAILAPGAAHLQTVIFGGAPAVVMCSNGTVDPRARATFEAVYKKLKHSSSGIACYSLDCAAPLPSGVSAAERFGLVPAHPQLFFVGLGRKPQQLSPALAGSKDALEKEVRRLAVNRPMRIDHTGDFTSCVRDRSGGCLTVYSARNSVALGEDVAPLVTGFPTIKFGTLNASSLVLRPPPSSPALRVINAGTKAAREASALAGIAGELLVLTRRVPAAHATDALLLTVGTVIRPGSIGKADVEALVAKAKRAMDAAFGGAAKGSSADAIDALLARDEALEALDTAIVTKGDLSVAHAAQKKKRPSEPAAKQQQQQQRKAAKRAPPADVESGRDDASKPAAALSPEAEAELERRTRAAMAAEEANSAFVAHMADEDEQQEELVEHLRGDEADEGEVEDEDDHTEF